MRGADEQWIRELFDIALVPSVVIYLKADLEHLIPRVAFNRGFDYWESGMDVRMGKDLYESFMRYQSRVIRALDSMAERYDFATIDTSRTPEKIFLDLKKRITKLLRPPKKARGRAREAKGRRKLPAVEVAPAVEALAEETLVAAEA